LVAVVPMSTPITTGAESVMAASAPPDVPVRSRAPEPGAMIAVWSR
jgi:hypothetical protein